MQDVYWNLLRTRIRQVPKNQRRHWTDADIAQWLLTFALDPSVKGKSEPFPSVMHVRRVCADLIGLDADE